MKKYIFIFALQVSLLAGCGPQSTSPVGKYFSLYTENIDTEVSCCGIVNPMENMEWLHNKMVAFQDSINQIDASELAPTTSFKVVLYTYDINGETINLLYVTIDAFISPQVLWQNIAEGIYYDCDGVAVDTATKDGILTEQQEVCCIVIDRYGYI